MVVKLIGKVDNVDIIFTKAMGDDWEAVVPYDLDGEYIVELTAIDEAGNMSYVTKYLFIVNTSQLCVKLLPLSYAAKQIEKDYRTDLFCEGYMAQLIEENVKGEECNENKICGRRGTTC